MSRSLSNILRDAILRKYVELIGILYFLFLAMMCAVELVRNTPEVMLPIAAPMVFDMAALSLALLLSVLLGQLAQFKYFSGTIDDEINRSFFLWFGLFYATVFLYSQIEEMQTGLIFSKTTLLFVMISACILMVQSYPNERDKEGREVNERHIIQWLRNLRQSYGIVVPVFVLLFFAELFISQIIGAGLETLLVDLKGFILSFIPAICVIVCSIIITKRFVRYEWSMVLRIGLVIGLSICMGGLIYFKIYLSDASIILFPLSLGYLILAADRVRNWYELYIVGGD
jgi:hypothetical protein